MNQDQKAMVQQGINSNFWKWYVEEVLEPEYLVARNVLLQGDPLKPDDLGKQSFYKGVIYVLERIKKNPETWLEISQAGGKY